MDRAALKSGHSPLPIWRMVNRRAVCYSGIRQDGREGGGAMARDPVYEALVREALEKLEVRYGEISSGRAAALDRIRAADEATLRRVLDALAGD